MHDLKHLELKTLYALNAERPLQVGETVVVFNKWHKGSTFKITKNWEEWSGCDCWWWVRCDVTHCSAPLDSIMEEMKDTEEDFQPVLYIIMRMDIDQMNPGKAIAQGAHAQSKVSEFFHVQRELNDRSQGTDRYTDWSNEGEDFGTTIVLEATADEIDELLRSAGDKIAEYCFQEVYDETYPYTNHYGDTYTKGIVTCWAFFAHDKRGRELMSNFKLHR